MLILVDQELISLPPRYHIGLEKEAVLEPDVFWELSAWKLSPGKLFPGIQTSGSDKAAQEDVERQEEALVDI
jgi:hypothetical protein